MAGLVPAIHVSVSCSKKNVDARHKAGHDESRSMNLGIDRFAIVAAVGSS
jgi:hypothetical protein